MNQFGYRRLAVLLLASVVANWLPLCACALWQASDVRAAPAENWSRGSVKECCAPDGSAGQQGGSSKPCQHDSTSCRCHQVTLLNNAKLAVSQQLDVGTTSPVAMDMSIDAFRSADPGIIRAGAECVPRPPPTPVQQHILLLI